MAIRFIFIRPSEYKPFYHNSFTNCDCTSISVSTTLMRSRRGRMWVQRSITKVHSSDARKIIASERKIKEPKAKWKICRNICWGNRRRCRANYCANEMKKYRARVTINAIHLLHLALAPEKCNWISANEDSKTKTLVVSPPVYLRLCVPACDCLCAGIYKYSHTLRGHRHHFGFHCRQPHQWHRTGITVLTGTHATAVTEAKMKIL